MSLAKETFMQIKRLTNCLIQYSICNDQNVPIKRPNVQEWSTCRIGIQTTNLTSALKNVEYAEMYHVMSENRNYNFRLIDGALIMLQYEFEEDVIIRHTLSYYPNPDILSYQDNEDLYLDDELYSDITDKRIMIVPLRFDYDGRANSFVDVVHPKSHFTLGQFEKCRIPVTRPLMPCQFVHFILRNFYNSLYMEYQTKIYNADLCFDLTISDNEKRIIHVSIQ